MIDVAQFDGRDDPLFARDAPELPIPRPVHPDRRGFAVAPEGAADAGLGLDGRRGTLVGAALGALRVAGVVAVASPFSSLGGLDA